ncbi:hypothetical protein FIBSPDRAFT_862430 [Athelia psychrophila]|uniref:Uncharacterized protein n=1 Tax=Athelia psychrophila TaxID=1759441 RepID=A0A166IEJ0_9AGAM|nr:hypothetical protein FIBSPDRAFT_862430 [Fibularhizoctonia sp. CBS 109695]
MESVFATQEVGRLATRVGYQAVEVSMKHQGVLTKRRRESRHSYIGSETVCLRQRQACQQIHGYQPPSHRYSLSSTRRGLRLY